MGAFQLIIQEQWVELTSEVMHQTVSYVAYASSILFFLPVHLIGSLVRRRIVRFSTSIENQLFVDHFQHICRFDQRQSRIA